MAQKVRIEFYSSETKQEVLNQMQQAPYNHVDFFKHIAGLPATGTQIKIFNNDDVAATGTFTFSNTASANDTVVINGLTFTGKASASANNEWTVGASATASAAGLAAAINASTSALITGTVWATSAAGVCTVRAVQTGVSGNLVTIAKGVDSGSVNTVSGARLTGGTEDTSTQKSVKSFKA